MVSGSDTSDDDFDPDSFRLVRRCPSSDKQPTSIMAALSPDRPSFLMCDGAQSQPTPGTDPGNAGAVDDAPMAVERRSPDGLLPRSGSGARRRKTSRRRFLRPVHTHTVESIFSTYKKRQGALIRALIEDEEAFFQKCDPGMPPLHLYGRTDGSWEVKEPTLELPAPEPEPSPGINKVRDNLERRDWLQLVAAYCDAWLMSISHFTAQISYMTATERGRLFAMIGGLPTVTEILLVHQEKSSSGQHEANEAVEEREIYLMEEKRSSCPSEANEVLEEDEEDDPNDDNNFCARCNSRYKANAFWICCDSCEKWYHGKCVNITSSAAEHMEHYECLDCYHDKYGHDSD